MKNFFKSIGRLFMDSQGNASSKRFVGILCGVSLCITLYANSYTHGDIKPSDTLVNAVAMLAFGCLGLTSTEKIFGKKTSHNHARTVVHPACLIELTHSRIDHRITCFSVTPGLKIFLIIVPRKLFENISIGALG